MANASRTALCVLLFDGFTALDAFGPVDVLSRAEGIEARFLSIAGGIVCSGQGLRIETLPLKDMEDGGLLLLPGGFGTRKLVRDAAFLQALKKAAERSAWVLAVCTGSALLAMTGLLDGRRATTNRLAFGWAESLRDAVHWVRDARWTSDGKYYASAGVSAGIDMALGFVADRWGEKVAMEICRKMEYRWNRDL